MDYNPYEASHVLAQLQLLPFLALAFTWLKLAGIYPPELQLGQPGRGLALPPAGAGRACIVCSPGAARSIAACAGGC